MLQLELLDWAIWLFYVLTGIFLIYFFPYNRSTLSTNYRFLGFVIKTVGGLSFALIYIYSYGGGDTTQYFQSLGQYSSVFYKDPNSYFELLFSNAEDAQVILRRTKTIIFYSHTSEDWFFTRLMSPLYILGFKSYLGVTFFMSLISYWGSLKYYRLMTYLLPGKEKLLFALNFMIPSVIFWGSGIMKDTITFAVFGYVLLLFYELITFRKRVVWNVVKLLIACLVIFQLKAYIVLAFMPWVALTLFMFINHRIKSVFFKVILFPIVVLATTIFAYYSSSFLIESSSKYNSERIIQNIQGFHSWHTQLGGSAYSLGEVEYTPIGLAKKIPASVNVSLFRPYPWEAGSAFMMLTSVESICILLLTLYLLFMARSKIFKLLFQSEFLTGALVFCLFFAFAIGVSTYNFGALARFRIPLLIIYVFIILYCIIQLRNFKSSSQKTPSA